MPHADTALPFAAPPCPPQVRELGAAEVSQLRERLLDGRARGRYGARRNRRTMLFGVLN
jgi:hypothetical protein